MPGPEVPLEFLLDSSNAIVGEYELSRLNLAANLKKELRAIVERIIDETAEARVARWLMDNRARLGCTVVTVVRGEEPLDFGGDPESQGFPQAGAPRGFAVDAD